MKARELTDDWIQRWRSSESSETDTLHVPSNSYIQAQSQLVANSSSRFQTPAESVEVGVQTSPNRKSELKTDETVEGETDILLSRLNSLVGRLTLEEVSPWTYCRAIWCYNRHLRFVMHRKNDASDCRLCNCCSRRTYSAGFHCHTIKHLVPETYSLPGEAWV